MGLKKIWVRSFLREDSASKNAFYGKSLFFFDLKFSLIKEQYKDKISDSSASQFVCSLLSLVSRSDVNKNVDVRMFGQI